MNPKDIALMFYVSGAKKSFENVSKKKLEKLAKEISSLSLTIDISQPHGAYSDKDLKIAVERASDWNDNKPLKMLKFTGDQRFSITIDGKVYKENVSCMQLMAIMTFCIDTVKGGQLKKMAGFDYLRHGTELGL
jgi:hypothetical protein